MMIKAFITLVSKLFLLIAMRSVLRKERSNKDQFIVRKLVLIRKSNRRITIKAYHTEIRMTQQRPLKFSTLSQAGIILMCNQNRAEYHSLFDQRTIFKGDRPPKLMNVGDLPPWRQFLYEKA